MLMEDLKDELRLAYHEMDQLVSLQRAGLLTMSDFLRMSHEISKTNADRLEEARGDDASAKSSEQSEMMVDESGNLLEATSALDDTGSGSEVDAAEKELSVFGSFSDEVGEDLSRDEEVRDELAPLEFPMGTPSEEEGAEINSARGSFNNEGSDMAGDSFDSEGSDMAGGEVPKEVPEELVLTFPVGTPVIVNRCGKWSGVVTNYGHDAANFLTAGKYQVKYELKTKKGRGFTSTTTSAWVGEHDLALRVVSPRQAKQTAESKKSSVPASRPNTKRQPDFSQELDDSQDDSHPALAAHERGRKLQKKATETQYLLGERRTAESKVPVEKRLREFANHSLMADGGNLFCRCCKEKIRNIKSTINTHVSSPTHVSKYAAWLQKHATQTEVNEFLSEYFKANPKDEMSSLPPDVLLYRYNVMETFLAAGLPPSKIDDLKGLLRGDVVGSSHMKDFIPKVEAFEFQRLREEIKGQKVTVIFDGTTRLGEAIAVLLRWCPSDFGSIQMRLVTLQTAEKHMDGAELCAFVNEVLTKACQLNFLDVVGGSRDSCSTNGTAMRNLKVVMIELEDFMCVSHTLSKLGEHIDLSTLYDFMTHWLGLVQHHPSAKRLWKEETGGDAMQGYSTIRWCSREVVQNELAVKLGTHISDFVDKLLERDIGDAHPKKMRQILDSKFDTLQLELALSLDLERIINSVHRMEGDGLVILLAYGEIDALLIFGDSIGDNPYTMPNVAKLLREKIKLEKDTKIYEYFEGLGWFEGKISSVAAGQYRVLYSDGTSITQSEQEIRQWVDVRHNSEWKRLSTEAKKGFAYLKGRLDGSCNNINFDCRSMWKTLRLVRAFDPSFAHSSVTEDMVRDLKQITRLRKMVPQLLKQLPDYLSAVQGFTVDHKDIDLFTKGVLEWWASNGSKFPAWAEAARIVFSFTPNSAGAERVFSLLKIFFGSERDTALADAIQSTLMLRYNKRSVGHAL